MRLLTIYKKLKAAKQAKGQNEFDESNIFYEANGGKNKRGLLFGMGSEVAFYGSSSSKTKATQPTNSEVQQLYNRLSAVEEENVYLKGELSSIRSLVEKIAGTSCTSSSRDCSSLGERPANVDEGQNINIEDSNEDLGDGLDLLDD